MNAEMTTSEEEQRAAGMMTAEQAEASANREQFFRQSRESLKLREPDLDGNGERLLPTPEQCAEMDRRLEALQKLLGDDIDSWQIDGALAISAYAGEYVGYHRDIDISLEADETAKLERRAIENGYGLFMGELFRDEQGETQYAIRPASLEQFIKERHHRFLVRTDKQGEVQTGGDLDFVDVHIRPRDENGREYGVAGVAMPEAWDQTTGVDFHGAKLNLPRLAKLTYFKLNADRPVDIGDLRLIAQSDHFSLEQYQEVEEMLKAERAEKLASVSQTVEVVATAFGPDMTEDDVVRLFEENAGSWAEEYSIEGRAALASMFFKTATEDMDTAKEQVVNAVANTLPRRREERLAEMKMNLHE